MSQIHPEQQLNFVLATFNKDKEMYRKHIAFTKEN